MADQKNLLLAIVISVAIILVSQFLLPGNKPQPQPSGQQHEAKRNSYGKNVSKYVETPFRSHSIQIAALSDKLGRHLPA